MVIIVGAGPIGLACGIELKQRNIPFMIIEKGCIVNSIFHYPVNMTFFSTSDRLEIGGVPFISHGTKPTRREALEYYRRVAESYKLPIHLYEEVTDVQGEDGNFTVTTDKGVYDADKLILATGFYGIPNLMNVPGENLPKVKHYYDEPHPYAFQKVLVVGAGNSGVDVALETYRCNAEVTLAVREDTIKDSVKYWVRPDIENRIKEGEITAYFNTTVKEITEHSVTLTTPDGEVELENDYVLAMTGYQPNYKLLNMFGLEFADDEAKTPIYDEITQESNNPGVFLAGVVCGGLHTGKWFIENSRVHSQQIADAIAQSDKADVAV